MLDLSQIFPANYPDIPSQQDIEAMFQDILNHSDSVNQVVCTIEEESCPYCKEALTHCLADNLDMWYLKRRPIAGYEHGNSWVPYWQQPKDNIRKLLNKFQTEQKHYSYISTDNGHSPAADCLDHSAIPLSQTNSIPSKLKSAIQQVAKELAAIKIPPAAQPIVIQNMPITIHCYLGDIGQVAETIKEQNIKQ